MRRSPRKAMRMPKAWPAVASALNDQLGICAVESRYLFLSFPLGRTVVVGGVGRVETDVDSLGALVSFFGFFTILLLRCSLFAIAFSLCLCCFAVGDMEPVWASSVRCVTFRREVRVGFWRYRCWLCFTLLFFCLFLLFLLLALALFELVVWLGHVICFMTVGYSPYHQRRMPEFCDA